MTRARTAADWRRRADRLGSRAMTLVGDWLAPGPRPGSSEPRISALVALVALAGGVLPIVIMVVTWAVRPKPVQRERSCPVSTAERERAGFVFADRPHDARYKPAAQCSSVGAENTLERLGTGRYRVTFHGLGRDGGVAEVTPVTPEDRICTLVDWRPDGDDERVEVDCFDRSGVPADSGFSARYWHLRDAEGTAAYLRIGDPGRTGQTLEDAYSYNSLHGTNSADREDVGSYVVRFGLQDRVSGGAVKVTAIGDTATVCGVQRWSGETGESRLAVPVRCRDGAGQPVDSRFAVTFSVALGAGPSPLPGAHLLADRPAEPEYTAAGVFQFNSTGNADTVTRSAAGEYRVALPGVAGPVGDLQITGYDTAATCVADPEHQAFEVRITCRAPSGEPADAQFVLILRQ
ncbi:hypothetical protein [Actinoplanes regularis]|nr:hypothetical protein [Actinoplanes regularis]GIE87529.1 hypothetical protein Are01nite_40090 [Actinoplanes regularis]